MAKQIKVIKCPNCGSVEKSEIKPEHYRCDNCNTEYFLDNDDINVNIKYQNKTVKNYFEESNKKAFIIIICTIVFIVVLISIISVSFNSKPSNYQKINTTPQQTKASSINTTVSPPVEQQNSLQSVNYDYCSLEIVDNKPYIISIVKREYSKSFQSKSKYYFVVHDLLANKIIQEQELDKLKQDSSSFNNIDWHYYDFSKNQTYLVANKSIVFLLNKNNFTLTNVTSSLLNNYPQYNTGIASVNITIAQGSPEHTFHILTDDGKKIYYYPLHDKAYIDNNDFYMEIKNFGVPDDTSEHTGFGFAEKYGDNFKLIKFAFVSPDGQNHYTITSANVGDNKPDAPGKYENEESAYYFYTIHEHSPSYQLISHQNLTPNRVYFDPKIVYYDDKTLIIKTKASANPSSHYNYQQLDINDGKVLWTLSDEQIKIKEIIPYKDGFIAKQSCGEYVMIGSNGTVTQKIVLTKEK